MCSKKEPNQGGAKNGYAKTIQRPAAENDFFHLMTTVTSPLISSSDDDDDKAPGNAAVPKALPLQAMASKRPSMAAASPFKRWLLQGYLRPEGPHQDEHEAEQHAHTWWQVMCLTGVDYFSTLGYQPGIAALAAGALSPIATLILILLTVFGAYPVYRQVAKESPHGEGSISMLEHLLLWWQGKLFVLALLGFVATDFVITITLSAADATAHAVENPFAPAFFHGNQIGLTLFLVALLAGVFLKGFKEAIGIAVVLVALYLGLNVVVIGTALFHLRDNPGVYSNWLQALTRTHGGNPFLLVGTALLLFPKLALGLSGFETGVAVMPLIKGDPTDTPSNLAGRVRNTQKLLVVAALIMSVFLLLSSIVTTLLIPPAEFQPGGKANGRALAFLAHQFLGDTFGTVYDVSTIAILWFAGASAMAGLLNIVPRYLPRYGMAPEWTRASRPLVLVFAAIAFIVTLYFKADVDAQGGAYATGVLVLMTSASVAVAISARSRKKRVFFGYCIIAAVFAYTTVVNVIERPDGVKIAAFFIGTIVLVSLVSRVWRTLELRVSGVEMDEKAEHFVRETSVFGELRLIPNHPDAQNIDEYRDKQREVREDHQIPQNVPILFVEVYVRDASTFADAIRVEGVEVGEFRILRVSGVAIPNTLAALLLHLRDMTGKRPHAYFNWSEGSPIIYLIKYVLSGQGDIAPVTHEVLRKAEPDPRKRPAIHAAM